MSTTALEGRSRWIDWGARLAVVFLLGQSLFFKFTAAPESVALFESLGAASGIPGTEPAGRIAIGVLELASVLLLLLPRTAALGALLAAGTMTGALLSHLLWLGIAVQGDGGILFGMALTAFLLSLVVLVIRRCEIPVVGKRICAHAVT